MQEGRKEEFESNIDIKGTISKFIKEDAPEFTQEEAILKYSDIKRNKKIESNNDDSDNENTEEQEHLKRVKKELLESLKRVNELEKKIYGEEKKSEKKDLKIEDKYKAKVELSRKKEINNEYEKNKLEREER